MPLYSIDTKLSDAIMAHPSLIPVVNRLGVILGVGDRSVGRICEETHIRPDFFLSVINTFINEEYFPANARDAFSVERTIDYLRKTSLYYRNVQLPNIVRHFSSLIERSGTENNLGLLQKFFLDMKQQLEWCLTAEENRIFVELEKEEKPKDIESIIGGYAEVGEKLHDLLTFLVVHLRGSYDRNLCMAVVSAVYSLERDMRQNNRIRTRILIPLICG